MQRMIEINSRFFIPQDSLPDPSGWETVFGEDRPLALEIGCGVGDFIAKTASDDPGTNFIAIDYYNKGCDSTCRRLERYGISNVRVVRIEARQFILERLTKGSLASIYINCPDPWPKQRHRKRRLVNREFVEFIRGYLVPGGNLYFATDFDDYGIDVASMMSEVAGFENVMAPDLYQHELEGYHLSKYMLKFMAEGKKIYFVNYKKNVKGEK
jgi:tRNA (guanine-N7-)-methyltransferase